MGRWEGDFILNGKKKTICKKINVQKQKPLKNLLGCETLVRTKFPSIQDMMLSVDRPLVFHIRTARYSHFNHSSYQFFGACQRLLLLFKKTEKDQDPFERVKMLIHLGRTRLQQHKILQQIKVDPFTSLDVMPNSTLKKKKITKQGQAHLKRASKMMNETRSLLQPLFSVVKQINHLKCTIIFEQLYLKFQFCHKPFTFLFNMQFINEWDM